MVLGLTAPLVFAGVPDQIWVGGLLSLCCRSMRMATSSRRAVSAPLRPQSASCDWCAVAPELLGGRDAVKPGIPTLRTVGTGDHTKRPRLLRRRAHPPRPLHASRAFPVLRPLSHDSSHCCGASRTGLSHHKRSMVPSASVHAVHGAYGNHPYHGTSGDYIGRAGLHAQMPVLQVLP